MYKNHTSMPQIMQQAHVHTLKSITLIKSKVTQQEAAGCLLQHTLCCNKTEYSVLPAKQQQRPSAYPLRCAKYVSSSEDSDSSDDNSSSMSEHTASITCKNTKDFVPAEKREQYDTVNQSKTIYTKCTQIENTYINPQTHETEVLFAFRICNLYPEDSNFNHKALDAMQQFIDTARKEVEQNKDPFTYENALLLTTQKLHLHKHSLSSDIVKTQFRIQLDSCGRLVYVSVKDLECTDRSENTLICMQDYILRRWNGYIQHIDYKCLYDSLNALFAVVYINSDIQAAVLCDNPIDAQEYLYRIFRGMHFPAVVHKKAIQHYQRLHVDDADTVLNMPLAFTHCEFEDIETINITELAHMSIILDLHRDFIPLAFTFAYDLASRLVYDLQQLWIRREALMPVAHTTSDLLEYGIVPVAQDMLPHDYEQYLRVPEYMKSFVAHDKNTEQYLDQLYAKGTNEMCTWGYATAFLSAAIRASMPANFRRRSLLTDVEIIATSADSRFMRFSGICNIHALPICSNMAKAEVHLYSGQAMPLFCMVICNVMSLSQAINNITKTNGNNIVLNTDNMIRVIRISDKTNEMFAKKQVD